MTTLAAGTVVEIRPQGFVNGVLVAKGPAGTPGADGADGSPGAPGPANTLAIGTVTTSAAGGPAAATVTGAAPNQTLNLTIPRGLQGPQGDQGPKGDPGTGNVNTVNGKVGPDITLNASDVGARPSSYVPAWTEVTGKPSTFAPSAHTHPQSDVTGLSATLAAKADLVAGVVPTSQIPAIALTNVVTVASQAAMLALTTSQVQPGDVATRSDGAGTFMLSGSDPSVLGNWTLLNAPTDKVVSVNGQIGTVVLGKTDVGLGNVDNTSDANKPVSTAQQTALNAKQDTSAKGAANGYASLGSDGKVPAAQLPTTSGASGPLARVSYNPASVSNVAVAQAISDVDASNLAITFTAPASGNVRITLEATIILGGTDKVWWLLREGTTNLPGTGRFAAGYGSNTTPPTARTHVEIALTGLTPGSSHTYKWGHYSSANSISLFARGGTEFSTSAWGPAIMEVYAE